MDKINQIWPAWHTVELIGRGGFGDVYKAKRELQGETFYSAVKVINIPKDEQDVREMMAEGHTSQSIRYYYESAAKDLLNEIKVLETLKSAGNVMNIEDFDVREREDTIGWEVYIRMELLENLDTYRSRHTMTPKDVVKLGIDLCGALEYCERSQIIHRDIKPKNIFVDRYGVYKLGDFGIARQMEKTQSTLSQKGTELYMAPEVRFGMSGSSYNVDIYSLGLVMYRLLNKNRMPFEPTGQEMLTYRDREQAVERRLKGERLPDPVDADRVLSDLIRKACEYDKDRRYQSAGEMKRDLTAYLEGKGSKKEDIPPEREEKEEFSKGVEPETDGEEETMRFFSQQEEKQEGFYHYSYKKPEKEDGSYHYSYKKPEKEDGSYHYSYKKPEKEDGSYHYSYKKPEKEDGSYHYSYKKPEKEDGSYHYSYKQAGQKEEKTQKKYGDDYRQPWHKPGDIVKPIFLFRSEAMIGSTRTMKEAGKRIELHIPKGIEEDQYIRIRALNPSTGGDFYYAIRFDADKAGKGLPADEAKVLRALDMNPGNLELWLQLGTLKQKKKMPEEAENCYRYILEAEGNYVQAYIAIGDLNYEKKDYANASRWYGWALTRAESGVRFISVSECGAIYEKCALAAGKLGDVEKAKSLLDEAVKKKFMDQKHAENVRTELGIEKKPKGFFGRWKK